MTLSVHARIGPYEVLGLLGSGGMGAVYRAHDTKLNRDVALKTLTASVADNADRLARFRREAQVLASLNHPNIGQIFGFEDGGPVPVLVLELVEGPTLAEMIAAPIPWNDAVAIARQIAEALEFAHERGVVHRDLKPANVKVRPDGTVKVLDFGLAKALDSSSVATDTRAVSESPTMTSPAMTQMGFILGTAAYMAPEQAKGRPVDRRADIWAFGVVLYEMLTGRRAYEHEDVAETIAAVLTRDVDLTALPADTPVRLRALLTDCLVRDPKQRLRDIGDARRVLDRVATGTSEESASIGAAGVGRAATPIAAPTGVSRFARALPWAIATAATLAAGALLVRALPAPPPAAPNLVTRARFIDKNLAGFISLSKDGSKLAYTVGGAGAYTIATRQMDQFDSRAIPGVSDGRFPVWSPDAEWVAFNTIDGKIRKIPIVGGTSVAVGQGSLTNGGDWGGDDRIVFSGANGLLRVASSGGPVETVTTLDAAAHETAHVRPQILHGGSKVLFTVLSATSDTPHFAVLDLSTHAYRIVAPGGDNGRYAATGHLTFVRDATLYAVPFDLGTLTVTGPEVPLIDSISTLGPDGTGDYAFSQNGLLVYVQALSEIGSTLAWADRKSGIVAIPGQVARRWGTGSLSPNGRSVANAIVEGKAEDIWIMDLERGVPIRVTNSPGLNRFPIWMPDGQRVVYAHAFEGKFGIYSVKVDGSASPTLVSSTPRLALPRSVTPDGRTLLYQMNGEAGAARILVAPLDAAGVAGEAHPLRTGDAADTDARVSPDGKWVAFASNQSGGAAVYLMPFPGPGGVTRISPDRGREPRWSPDGRQLFFWEGTARDALWSVTVQTAPALSIGTAVKVLSTGGSGTTWDVAPDGRFLIERPPPAAQNGTTFVMVTNWFDELRRRAPARKP